MDDWRDIFIVLALMIALLDWINIPQQRLFNWLRGRILEISEFVYVFTITLLTLLSVYIFIVFPISMEILDGKWALLLAIVVYFSIGMWSPIITRLPLLRRWFIKIQIYLNRLVVVAILVGYWIISWPDEWLIPLLMTCLLAFLIIVIVIRHICRRLRA